MTNGTDYRAILASDTPLIDVRAPVEFSQSAMPAAINLPLMNDEERAAVGTCYKRRGRKRRWRSAISWSSGDLRASRIQLGWKRAPVTRTVSCAALAAASARISSSSG